MTSRDSVLAQGIAAARTGDKSTARRLLTQAVRRAPDSESAWIWLSSVLDTPQGRAFCLRRVLEVNPQNLTAQKGLAALESAMSAPAATAPPAPDLPPRPADVVRPRRPPVAQTRALAAAPAARPPSRLDDLTRHPRFWPAVVACLAVVALSLVGMLAYASINSAGAADQDALAAVAPSPTPWPRGTLRPTFTATPTNTPTPTATPTPTPTFTPTFTPMPTDTPTATPTATRRPQRPAAPTPTPLPPTPRPTQPPRSLDPRLAQLGVRIEPASARPGQLYWRMVEARWTDEGESGGKHSIYVEVLDLYGLQAIGQPVTFQWTDGKETLSVEQASPPDWGVNFPMYNTLGSYTVSVDGAPSDRVVALGLGSIEQPDFTIHTSFYLTFRLVVR
jgi:hypothetical protein